MKRTSIYCALALLLGTALSACNGNQRDTDQISTDSPTTTHSTNPDDEKTPIPTDTATTQL